MTPEEKEKLLDQPVFGPDGMFSKAKQPSLDDVISDLKKPEDGQAPSSAKKDDVAQDGTQEGDGDEARVPVSRFRKTREELIALREAQAARDARDAEIFAELARLREQVSKAPRSDSLPEKWVKLYGDSEESKEAYNLYQDQLKEMLQTQRQSLESEQQQRTRDEAAAREGVAESIDEGIEDLQATTGKTFTDAEKEGILDVVERYSPENGDGTFSALIPLDRAYQIYEMEQANKKGGAAKRRVAEIASADSDGQGGSAVSRPTTLPSWDNVGKRWGL